MWSAPTRPCRRKAWSVPSFDERAFEAQSVHLEHNYRSGAEIIRIANLIQRGRRPVTGRQDGESSATCCPGGFADQCRQAVHVVKQAITRGVPLHEIVVICPTNDQCRDVTNALRKAGVSAFVRGTEYRLTQAKVAHRSMRGMGRPRTRAEQPPTWGYPPPVAPVDRPNLDTRTPQGSDSPIPIRRGRRNRQDGTYSSSMSCSS